MSSSIDQRATSKEQGETNSTEASSQQKSTDYSAYMPNPAVQGGYSSSQVAASTVSDPYLNYYGWGMPYANQMLPSNLWGNRNSAYNYGTMSGEYVPSTPMFNQYDYVDWYHPGLDQAGAATWGQPVLPVHKSNDYLNGSYYNAVGGSGGANIVENAFDNEVESSNGAMSAMEQSFKGMQVVDDERETGLYSGKSLGTVGTAVPKKSWANIASQPARNALPRPKGLIRTPVVMTKQGIDGSIGTSAWETKPSVKTGQGRSAGDSGETGAGYYDVASAASGQNNGGSSYTDDGKSDSAVSGGQNYNPKEFDLNPKAARYFVIKSFSEDDIHRSIKYGIWCSTEYGNKRLDAAFHERTGKGPVFLFFSVNGSGHFCGMAQMTSPVDYHSSANVWAQDKWKGQFSVRWIYVKDVPNSQLRHIKLENNENKPVTNSRDTQEIPSEKGKSVLRIIHQYRHTTSIFDDFSHNEKQQAETSAKKVN